MGDLEKPWRVPMGKECSRCGEFRIDRMCRDVRVARGYTTMCRTCDRVRGAQYYMQNREAGRARRRAWYQANKDVVVVQVDPARMERRKAWLRSRLATLASRPESQVLAARSRLRPDGMKTCNRCQKTLPLDDFNRDRTREDGLGARCRKCQARSSLQKIAEPLWASLGLGRDCIYCGAPRTAVDHVIPVSRGGLDTPTNLVPTCGPCNSSKNARDVFVWLAGRAAQPTTPALAFYLEWALNERPEAA